jgi:PIN domain nuclease of toxin-antitoxin system
LSRLLIDTMVFIWSRENSREMPKRIRRAVESATTVYVSMASGWEMAIKAGLGRLRLAESFDQGMARGGYELLDIEFAHLDRVALLPHHHRDPFDRMLIAQALVEGLTIATVDAAFAQYEAPLVDR